MLGGTWPEHIPERNDHGGGKMALWARGCRMNGLGPDLTTRARGSAPRETQGPKGDPGAHTPGAAQGLKAPTETPRPNQGIKEAGLQFSQDRKRTAQPSNKHWPEAKEWGKQNFSGQQSRERPRPATL